MAVQPSPLRPARLTALLLLTVACGGPAAADPDPADVSTSSVGGGGGAGSGGDAPPLAEGCPPTIEQAEDQLCAADGGVPEATCAYAGGAECRCAERPYCSGAERLPDPVENYVWVCDRPPPEVRPDGCPGSMPPAGGDCDPVGKRCGYGDCCFTTIECTADGWSEPPPATCPP